MWLLLNVTNHNNMKRSIKAANPSILCYPLETVSRKRHIYYQKLR